jgi:hypothetical protein
MTAQSRVVATGMLLVLSAICRQLSPAATPVLRTFPGILSMSISCLQKSGTLSATFVG